MAQKLYSLRVFFLPPGLSPLQYPRIAALCHVCIVLGRETFTVAKSIFTKFQGEEYPIDELNTFLQKVEELHNGETNGSENS